MEEPTKTLEAALSADNEGSPSILKHEMTPAPKSISEFLNHPKLHGEPRQIKQKEARRIYKLKIDENPLEAAEKALSEASRIGLSLPMMTQECVFLLRGMLTDGAGAY